MVRFLWKSGWCSDIYGHYTQRKDLRLLTRIQAHITIYSPKNIKISILNNNFDSRKSNHTSTKNNESSRQKVQRQTKHWTAKLRHKPWYSDVGRNQTTKWCWKQKGKASQYIGNCKIQWQKKAIHCLFNCIHNFNKIHFITSVRRVENLHL